jgi:23S rRNA pseudouridine2605 synthase
MKDPKFDTPLKVVSLSRVSIGSLKLDIESGKWRYLSKEEEDLLLKGLTR